MYSPFEHTRYHVWSGAVAAQTATVGVTWKTKPRTSAPDRDGARFAATMR
jgi:hypothetical protein